jgi:deoxyribonuclease-1
MAWEQIVPVRAFGANRACWKSAVCKDEQGQPYRGVKCCRQSDPSFASMETDLHNFAPVVAEIKEDRGAFGFGEVEREPRMYGQCDFEADRDTETVEPPEDKRGDVARAYLYMHETYGDAVSISAAELEMFKAWHEADPPDGGEIERNARIHGIQGKANPFIPLPG